MGRIVRIGAVVALLLVVGGPRAADAAPQPESALPNVTQVDVSDQMACARLSNGTARCWGFEESGSLGNGAAGAVTGHPVTVRSKSGAGPLTGVTQVAVGRNTACALLASRQVRCWGESLSLGAGPLAPDADLPVVVRNAADTGPLTGVTQISATFATFCARLVSGQARCWGLGPVGDGTSDDGIFPRVVQGDAGPLTGVTQVSAGVDHACARLTTGQVRCWGGNADGQLGDDSLDEHLTATPVKGPDGDGLLAGVTQVEAGDHVTCARVTGARAYCWGDNDDGRLGDGTLVDSTVPTAVQDVAGDDDLRGVTSIVPGDQGSCARLGTGQVRCWGSELLGNGDEADTLTTLPVAVRNRIDTAPLANVQSLAVSEAACAVLLNGQLRCWGNGSSGELGNGTTDQVFLPVVVLRN
jgi:alpha-tubulin suppressor-like RCC1 family protein